MNRTANEVPAAPVEEGAPAPNEEQRDSPPTGRIPPHNLQAEEALLGAMLLSRDAISVAVTSGVSSADLYKPAHADIFQAILDLYAAGRPVDPTTVADALRRSERLEELGGRKALLRLQAGTPASANASQYARIVAEHSLLRAVIAAAGQISDAAWRGEPVESVLGLAEDSIFALSQRAPDVSHPVPLDDAVQDELDRMSQRTGALLGIPTGFHDLDAMLLGFQGSQLIVGAGRPGTGKSSLALGCALYTATVLRRPVLFESLEMSPSELVQRVLAMGARVGLRELRTFSSMRQTLNDADWNRIQRAVAAMHGAPLEIGDSTTGCTIMDIRARARRMKARYGDLGLVVVDYLQLMDPLERGRRAAENRQVEVSEISRGLKVLSRELDVPVLALSQLNRMVEQRADKRPMLSDLRESGSIENDADVVLLLFRPAMYATSAEERDRLRYRAEIDVAKHRNGPTGVVHLRYHAHQTRFEDVDPPPDPFEQGALLPPA